MLEIINAPLKPEVTVCVPGSKSYTHRVLVAAALACGQSEIKNPLVSDDTLFTLGGLEKMGVVCRRRPERIIVQGISGRPEGCRQEIYLGNSGTSMRLLIAFAALAPGGCILTGNRRMCQRPVGPLLRVLKRTGVVAEALERPGCPPVKVKGPLRRAGHLTVDCSVSSQYLSALLLIAPCLEGETTIEVSRGPVSRPYIDLTLEVMEIFGIRVIRKGYTWFKVEGGQVYSPGTYRVPPDMSQAGYFWAAAAVAGNRVTVDGAGQATGQGDLRLADLLVRMGCRKTATAGAVSISGGPLRAIQADMGDLPDVVPTLAVVAAFARGTTRLNNVGHLKAKESDRLAAVTNGLSRMGIETRSDGSFLEIIGGSPGPALIDTCGDHRLAMSFAVAGLKVPGIKIDDPECVSKSFPGFWQVFQELYL